MRGNAKAQGTPRIPHTTPGWEEPGRRRALFYGVAALLLAFLAAGLTYLYLEQIREQAMPGRESVVVASDLRPGAVIEPGMVMQVAVPEAVLPADAITDPAQALGRALAQPVAERQILRLADFVGERGSSLSARLPEGHWAVVIPQGWFVAPLPQLQEGDRLDLLAYQSGRPIEDAGVIVQGVEVIGLGMNEGQARELTLAVTMEQAIAILYGRANQFSLLPLLRPEGAQP